MAKMTPESASPTAYDVFPYISGARNVSSIERLATAGRLVGLDSPLPGNSKVLELGCGDGGNILPMAVSFPQAEFTGVDLAKTAIERATRSAREAGIPNVRFIHGSFAEAPGSGGEFDYVIAHGVYSWIPEVARHELLDVVRTRMQPVGVALVSYNALPGSQIRGLLGRMMRLHTRSISDPMEKITQARALLALLAHAPSDAGDIYRPLLRSEVGHALQRSDELLYHDDLADISEPFFFADFMANAHEHGLEFAGEANFHQMSITPMPPEVQEPLAELAQRDLLAKEQYLDFLTCRSFRHTLLCHAEASTDRAIDTERVRKFRIASNASPDRQQSLDGDVRFAAPNGSTLQTNSRFGVAALTSLAKRYPRSISFDELARTVGASDTNATEEMAELLFAAFGGGVVEFHVAEPAAVFEISDRPAASPWARYKAATGRVVNLYHETLRVDGTRQAIIGLLDGTRSVASIAEALQTSASDALADVRSCASLGLLIG